MMAAASEAAIARYVQQGFVDVAAFFSLEEVARFLCRCEAEDGTRNPYARLDPDGRVIDVATWDPADAENGELAECWARLTVLASELLGEPACHFHAKFVSKRAATGGSWQWHQDYWNWYHAGFLFPDMVNICIALDPMRPENGGLQLVPGSHRLGRLDHVLLDRDGRRRPLDRQREPGEPIRIGVDPERLDAVLERLPVKPCQMEPGDVVAFHGNCIHGSGANRSAAPRRALICCFHAASNGPVAMS